LHELDTVNSSHNCRVRLEILDNASTDGSDSFLRQFVRPDFIVHRNEMNIGGDNNIRKCASIAEGEYVWVFGDDDLILPGGIQRVLSGLERYKPLLVVLVERQNGGEWCYPDYKRCIESEIEKDKFFPLSHTLISANVFSASAFSVSESLARSATNYGHMYGLLAGLRGKGDVVVLDGVLQTRSVRASFARIPFALCIKQAVYLRDIATWFDMPRLRQMALRLVVALPVELLSHAMHFMFPGWMRRRLVRKAGRHG